MYRGTTPTFAITLPTDIPVNTLTGAYLTFEQNGETLIEKQLSDFTQDTTNNALLLELTQEETLKFTQGQIVNYQLRFKTASKAYSSEIWKTLADRIIKDGEI